MNVVSELRKAAEAATLVFSFQSSDKKLVAYGFEDVHPGIDVSTGYGILPHSIKLSKPLNRSLESASIYIFLLVHGLGFLTVENEFSFRTSGGSQICLVVLPPVKCPMNRCTEI